MPYYDNGTVRIFNADCRAMTDLEDGSVQCVVTSPPYWGLRDYGVDGQIGLEKTPEEYVAKMVTVFREVWRVLKDDGTLWLNLGDSYATGSKGGEKAHLGDKSYTNKGGLDIPLTKFNHGLKPKDLVGIPWRVAFALQQPYEHVLIGSREYRAWMAGIIDGEGCITSNAVETNFNPSYPIILQVRMSDREALQKIVAITGVSKVQDEHLSPSQVGTLQRAPSCWKTSGENAMRLLAECFPYLTVKRSQALVAWNLQKLKDGVETKQGTPIPKENMEKRSLLYSVIRELNQRREVDLPSWLKEPSIESEPGWYLRSDCIWHKPNPMPESVTDRPTKAHEYLFLMAKSQRYYYDADAIREPVQDVTLARLSQPNFGNQKGGDKDPLNGGKGNVNRSERRTLENLKERYSKEGVWSDRQSGYELWQEKGIGRNRRSVWTIPTAPYPEAHFATFPEALVEPCILAGSRVGDTILDPFAGSGTTLWVAQRLGRKAVGYELKAEYCDLAIKRVPQLAMTL